MHLTRGQLQQARTRGEELLSVAQQQHDPLLRLEAHRALGNTLIWLGELDLALTHDTHVLALYDPQQHRAHALRWGQDSGIACRSGGAVLLWLLGYPDQARQWSDDALGWARALAHPFTLQQSLLFSTILQQGLGQTAVAQEHLEAQLALCTEQGFALYLAWGTVFRGSTLAAQGQWAEGIAQIRAGMATLWAMGMRTARSWCLALLAEACGRAGQVEEGLRTLEEALEVLQSTEDRFYAAEVYRLKGELLLQQARPDEAQAETCLQQALAVARRQQAKSLELRAAMSLARLSQRQGQRAAARELLAPVYGWFTEGFDTADLQEARALLEELAGQGPK